MHSEDEEVLPAAAVIPFADPAQLQQVADGAVADEASYQGEA